MKTTSMALVTILAVGGLLTASIVLQAQNTTNAPLSKPQAKTPPGGSGTRGQYDFERIARQLNLTDEQKPKVTAVLDNHMQQLLDLRDRNGLSREERRAKIETIRQNTATKLQDILTPDQFVKWKKMTQRDRPNGPALGGTSPSTNAPPTSRIDPHAK
jgi:Spy/CpxP family protein refolding chaperone